MNQESIPELAPMHIVGVQQVEGDQVDEVSIEKRYDNMMELEQDLGVKLLGTAHSKDNPYISVQYKKMGEGYNLIKVSNYETGDLQDLKVYKDDGDASETQGRNENYIWTIGKIYKTPIDLEIEIISDEEQSFLDKEYMGYFKYVETYNSEQGFKVNILEDTIGQETVVDFNRYQPKVEAIFVADGIRYTLSGRVPIETMKQVIETMK